MHSVDATAAGFRLGDDPRPGLGGVLRLAHLSGGSHADGRTGWLRGLRPTDPLPIVAGSLVDSMLD
jgi:hypothetical protein